MYCKLKRLNLYLWQEIKGFDKLYFREVIY